MGTSLVIGLVALQFAVCAHCTAHVLWSDRFRNIKFGTTDLPSLRQSANRPTKKNHSRTQQMLAFQFGVTVLLLSCSTAYCLSNLRVALSSFRTKSHSKRNSSSLDKVTIQLERESYPIYIGNSVIDGTSILGMHVLSKKALIVTNTIVAPLYQHTVQHELEKHGVEVHVVVLPDGERYKTINSIGMVIDAAVEAKLDRQSCFIALGGGVVGDMCGFAASIYQRGVRFLQVPTTLMAMVDSSVGGKTGVNHAAGKNLIGSFHQPCAVVADLDTLRTLPDRELRSGLAEVIKYGLISDPQFFAWLEQNMHRVLHREAAALRYVVRRSGEIKAAVVTADEKEREGGLRATLNLGHTFAHAIETGLGYGVLLHGEAVSVGMMMAAELAQELGLIDADIVVRLRNLLAVAQLPLNFSSQTLQELQRTARHRDEQVVLQQTVVGRVGEALLPPSHLPSPPVPSPQILCAERFLQLMSRDKKVSHGQLSLVLLRGPLGSAVVTKEYDTEAVRRVVRRYCGLATGDDGEAAEKEEVEAPAASPEDQR